MPEQPPAHFVINVNTLCPPSTFLGRFLARVEARKNLIDPKALGRFSVDGFLAQTRNNAAWHHPAAAVSLGKITNPASLQEAISRMEDAHASLPLDLPVIVNAIGRVVVETGTPLSGQHLLDARLLERAGVLFSPPLPVASVPGALVNQLTPDQ